MRAAQVKAIKRARAGSQGAAAKRAKVAVPGRFFAAGPRAPAPELKVIDKAEATYGCNTTGSVTLLNGVAAGTDYTDRIGRRIQLASFQLRGLILPEDTSTNANLWRVMLVWDTQPNNLVATIAMILQQSTSTSMNNLDNRDRFRVLWDAEGASGAYATTATQAVAQSPSVTTLNEFRSLSLTTTFDGATSNINDINSGALYLVTIGNQVSGAASSLIASVRVRFRDA